MEAVLTNGVDCVGRGIYLSELNKGYLRTFEYQTIRLQVRILSPPNQWTIVHRDKRLVPTRLPMSFHEDGHWLGGGRLSDI